MKKLTPSRQQLQNEILEMRTRLEEAEETLIAIRNGEVDAFLVAKTGNIQTIPLNGTDYPYRTMVEAMNEGAVTLIPDGTIFFCNSHFSDMVRLPSKELVGSQFGDLVRKDEQTAFSDLLASSTQADAKGEFHLLAGDLLISVQISSSPLVLGEFVGVLFVVTDLTDRENSDAALFNSESILRSFYESVPMLMGVIELTSDDEIIHITDNPATSAFFNVEYLSYGTKSAGEIGAPTEAIDRWLHAYRESQQSNHPVNFEYIHPTQNGPRWLSATVAHIGPAVSGNVRFSYVAADITVRKHAEEALRTSETLVRSLFEHLPLLISVKDRKSVYITCNTNYAQDLGISPEEIVGKDDFAFFSPELAESYRRDDQFVMDTGTIKDIEERHQVIGKEEQWNHVIKLPFHDQQGRVVGVIGIYEDITKRKQAEELIQTRNNEILKLYKVARALAKADSLDQILDLVTRHSTENVQCTFACVALLEGKELVTRGFYPIRVLEPDLMLGKRTPIIDLPNCQLVLEQQKPVFLHASDPNISADEREALLLDFTHTLCMVPLVVGGDTQDSKLILGLLMLGEERGEEREPFTPGKIEMALNIGDQAANAIRRMQLREKTQRDARRFAALHAIDMAISTSDDLVIILNILLEHVVALLNITAADILLLNPHTMTLDYSAGKGFRSRAIEKSHLRLDEGYAGYAALEHRTVNVPDLRTVGSKFTRKKLLAGEAFVSYFGVPLVTKGKVIGLLDIFNRSLLTPDPEWLDFMEALAGQAAIAIDNATLFNGLQRSNIELLQAYDTTIEGWSRAMDLRDKETEGHTQRVAELTVRMAREQGLREEEIAQIRRGALLHDMGKLGVPDGILLKAGPLTDEEWVMMREHPRYAFDLLSPIDFLKPALDIPYCHHEKWDGTGYPRGLKGEQIPIAARLFAIVDVWDALRSDRPYRKAWSEEKALEYIKSLSGTHFDPEIVNLFLAT